MTVSETALPPLTITLFGPMQVQVQGQPLPSLRSRKAQWLLALLTLRHDRPVEREWLAGTLWPDIDQSQAFDNLRPVLSELRKALGSQSERLQSPNRHSLLLDLTGAEVDVAAFDAAVAGKNSAALERAVSLYRGPLLEGCTEEWVGQERGVREQDCLRVLQTLADAALASGDYETAVGYYRQAVGLDPWREAAQRGLMEALDRSGDSNAALNVYRQFVQLLRTDPKAVPDEKTSALYARLRTKARKQAVLTAEAPVVKEFSAQEAAVPAITGYLPHPLTDLVGREDERVEVTARLRRSRLVTLTGPGGIGKTRLALEIAAEAVAEYADGVWLVALEALTEKGQVAGQIADVLGLKEQPGRDALQSLTEHLRKKRLLLVLDNCEHLLEASAGIAGHLLRECAGVRLLATSREALGITGEAAWAVPSLAVPDPAHLPTGEATRRRVLMGYESVQLFVERAQAVQKTFALAGDNALPVAQICARLEGIPLAIELAAARVRVMTVEQIAARLNDHLGLLTGGSRVALPRQQTLRALIDWSYALLSDTERRLLGRVSVFAGGWSLDAAETVCAGDGLSAGWVVDGLTSLADKSLVIFEAREGRGTGRYRLLETVRQYAWERLDAGGDAEAVKARHREWFLGRAEEAETNLSGSEQGQWLQRLEAEGDNLRAVLARCEGDAQGVDAALRLAGALFLFWHLRGLLSEGRRYLEQALAREGGPETAPARAKAAAAAGKLAYTQGDTAASQTRLEESLALYRELGDRRGAAEALNNLGNAAHRQGNFASAQALHEESLTLYRELGNRRGIALALGNLGSLARERGDYAASRALIEESLGLYRAAGDSHNLAMALNNLGNIVRLQGDYSLARSLYEESLDIRRGLGDKPGLAWCLSALGLLACTEGDWDAAQTLHEECLGLRRELGLKSSVGWSLLNLGLTAQGRDDPAASRAFCEEGRAIFAEIGDRQGGAWALCHLGVAAQSEGSRAAANALHQEGLRLFEEIGDREGVAAGLKECAAAQESPEKAARLWGAAESLRESIGARMVPSEEARYARQVAQARASLGEESFRAAWAEGRALTWGQAATYALEE